ncbi:MAG: hypothetical protein AB7P34_03410 [Vicinamibacterales bacterium]
MMSNDTARSLKSTAVGASAIAFAVVGALLLFAPDEFSRAIIPSADGGPLMQVLGAALLGFASMNWLARGAALGGIYGRVVVAANQTHSTIGAIVLVKHGLAASGSPALWLVTGCYVLAASLFLYLSFFNSGLRER